MQRIVGGLRKKIAQGKLFLWVVSGVSKFYKLVS